MQLLFLQQWLPDGLLKALSWTFIHSLWQGLIAAVLAAVIILSTRKSSARLRYNLLGMVVIFFLMAAILTFSRQLKNGTGTETTVTPFLESGSDISIVYDESVAEPAGVTDELVNFLNANADLLVFAWAVFFLINCMKLVTGFAGVRRIRHYKTYSPPEDWQTRLHQLSTKLGIKKSVKLLQSGLVKVPVAIGFLKPVILVPIGLLSHFPPEHIETILLHELAHIRRKDYLMNILQRVAETVFFFNPALLWISSLIRQEREACCDDVVVANTTHKGSYLEALVSFQEFSLTPSEYAMAISTKRHYLFNRVNRMITRENKKLNFMEKIALVIGIVAVTAFTFIPKEESADKSNTVTINEPASVPAESVITGPAANNPVPATVNYEKPAPTSVVNDPVLEVSVNEPSIDTVPKKGVMSEIKSFNSVSHNINDDGTNKNEVVTVVDDKGNKYSYTRLNGKVLNLTVNDKVIPENEINNYSDLFEHIDRRRAEKEARKQEEKVRKQEEKIRKENEKAVRENEKAMRREEEKERKKNEDEIKENEKEKQKEHLNELKREENKLKKEEEKLKDEKEKIKKEQEREKEEMKKEEKRLKEQITREEERIKKENVSKDEAERNKIKRNEIARKSDDVKRRIAYQQRISKQRYDERMKRFDNEMKRVNEEKQRISRLKNLNNDGKNRKEEPRNKDIRAPKEESKRVENPKEGSRKIESPERSKEVRDGNGGRKGNEPGGGRETQKRREGKLAVVPADAVIGVKIGESKSLTKELDKSINAQASFQNSLNNALEVANSTGKQMHDKIFKSTEKKLEINNKEENASKKVFVQDNKEKEILRVESNIDILKQVNYVDSKFELKSEQFKFSPNLDWGKSPEMKIESGHIKMNSPGKPKPPPSKDAEKTKSYEPVIPKSKSPNPFSLKVAA